MNFELFQEVQIAMEIILLKKKFNSLFSFLHPIPQ